MDVWLYVQCCLSLYSMICCRFFLYEKEVRRGLFYLPFLHDLFTLQVLESDEFSEASDVWSFAYVVTEIFTFGKQPYQDWKNGKVKIISFHFGHAECHWVRCMQFFAHTTLHLQDGDNYVSASVVLQRG